MRVPSTEWLPFLRRLAERGYRSGVLKNADRALAGYGDLDLVAPADEHEMLKQEFIDWAREQHLRWLVECRHPGDIRVLVALSEAVWAQLDLVREMPFRGGRLFSAPDLVPLLVMDPRGFLRVREGSEGMLLFLYKGLRRGGHVDLGSLERYGILDSIVGDWEGAVAVANLLGGARRPLLSGIQAGIEGRWSRAPFMRVEALMAIRALARPGHLLYRAFVRWWSLPRCEVTRAISTGRQPGDLGTWLDGVRQNHQVRALGSA